MTKSLTWVRVLFSAILIGMIGVTAWASAEKGVMQGFNFLFQERWGIATLSDAYCGFITFGAWVVYKERSWISSLAWLVFILIFGNIAMAIYVLNELRKLPKGAGADQLLLRRGVA